MFSLDIGGGSATVFFADLIRSRRLNNQSASESREVHSCAKHFQNHSVRCFSASHLGNRFNAQHWVLTLLEKLAVSNRLRSTLSNHTMVTKPWSFWLCLNVSCHRIPNYENHPSSGPDRRASSPTVYVVARYSRTIHDQHNRSHFYGRRRGRCRWSVELYFP